MAGVLARMAIAPEVKDALLSRSGPYAGTLALVEAQERGDWGAVVDAAAAVGTTPADVSPAYTEALGWAGERLRGLGSAEPPQQVSERRTCATPRRQLRQESHP